MSIQALVLLVLVGTQPSNSNCDLHAAFYEVDTNAMLFATSVPHYSVLGRFVAKHEAASRATVEYIDSKLGANIRLCFGSYRTLTPLDLSRVEKLGVDRPFWSDFVATYGASASPVINPEYISFPQKPPLALRRAAEEKAKVLCARSQLELSEILRNLPVALDGQSRQSERWINIIILSCSPSGTFGRVGALGQIGSNIVEGISQLVKDLVGYQGLTVFGDDVPARSQEAPFLRRRRLGIQIAGVEARDYVLAHEIGHYLGLSHLSPKLPGICTDTDRLESTVPDTPVSVPTLDARDTRGIPYSKLQLRDRSEWPESCKPVSNLQGILERKVPLDNMMNWGSGDPMIFRFTPGQKEVMLRMLSLLE